MKQFFFLKALKLLNKEERSVDWQTEEKKVVELFSLHLRLYKKIAIFYNIYHVPT